MPLRLLRDTTDSENVNKLSYEAEVLFYRLMMKADDFGSFHGNLKLIKAACFPLRADTVTDNDISIWVNELKKAGLVVIYSTEGKTYLRINNFGQRLRNKKKKFPEVDSKSPQAAASGSNKRPEDEVEVEEEVEDEGAQIAREPFFQMFRRVAGNHINNRALMEEIAKFKNKYPNAHPNQSGALVNAWVGNIGKEKPIVRDKNSYV